MSCNAEKVNIEVLGKLIIRSIANAISPDYVTKSSNEVALLAEAFLCKARHSILKVNAALAAAAATIKV